jgi:hypothetical protein
MWTLALYPSGVAIAIGSVPKRRNPQRSYSAIAGALPSVTVSVTSATPGRALAAASAASTSWAAGAAAAARLVHEHADQVRLVPRLGLGRELDRHRAHEPAVVERAERQALTRGVGHALQPPRVRLGRALFGCRREGIGRGGIGVEHQLTVARDVRCAQGGDVHAGGRSGDAEHSRRGDVGIARGPHRPGTRTFVMPLFGALFCRGTVHCSFAAVRSMRGSQWPVMSAETTMRTARPISNSRETKPM